MSNNFKTPQDAKKLWCPMARYVWDEEGASNRWYENRTQKDDRNPWECRCIADECAMWRWENKDTGYCGLAGVPVSS